MSKHKNVIPATLPQNVKKYFYHMKVSDKTACDVIESLLLSKIQFRAVHKK